MQYAPSVWFVVPILATVFAFTLVSAGTVLAEGVANRAELDARLKGALTNSLNEDTLIAYGHAEALNLINDRPAGARGNRQHVEAVGQHKNRERESEASG